MLNFKKYGFVRAELEDFRDDGTSFKVYYAGDVKVTYARSCGEIYLYACFNYNYELSRLNSEYAKIVSDAGKIANKYNGTSYEEEINLESFMDAINYYQEKLDNFKCEKPVVYLNTLDNNYYAFVYEKTNWGEVKKEFKKVVLYDTSSVEVKKLGIIEK